jgi:hypothetical protein
MGHLASQTFWPGIVAIVLVILFGLIATWVGFKKLKRKRLIENVPTSKVKGVFLGLNEVKGIALSETPVTSFLAERSCIHYEYSIEEEWEREETTTDSDGKTETKTESGWTTVDSGGEYVEFDLRDDTGRLLVNPDGAEIQGDRSYNHICGRGDSDYYGKGPDGGITDSTHRRRFTEHILPLGAKLYVMGPARMREDIVAPMIAHDRDAEVFMISTRTEKQLTRNLGLVALILLVLGAGFAYALPITLRFFDLRDIGAAARRAQPESLLAAGIYGGAVLVFYLVLVYNGLVSVRERMAMAWSMIDVQLKRRHDLIPRLVACVKGASGHEQETQEKLAALRTQGLKGSSVQNASENAGVQSRALGTIFALAESYPDLKTDTNFASLQKELADTEDRIALAREFYNGTVEAVNTRIATLPDVLVARLTGFKEQSYFAADGFEKTRKLEF